MSILVLGLIGNSVVTSDFVFADKPDKEAKEDAKEAKEDAKEAKEDAKEAKEDAKEAKEDVAEFEEGVISTSSKSPTTDKVTICHIPPGNPGNAKTKIVGSSAVSAHLAHGDTEGPCDSANLEDIEDNKKEKVSICHIPPGNSGNAHTITVGRSAVSAHLAHGDIEEPCDSANLEDIEDRKAEKVFRSFDRSERLIEKLEKQIASLEKRLQTLIEKYESGEYYGNISAADEVTNSYVVFFEGTATSIDKTIKTEMSGELFLESQVTSPNTSKFKILSGEVIIEDNTYEVAFGKARATSAGSYSLVIIAQTIDSDDVNTVKLTLGFDSPLGGEFGNPPEEFEILDNSKVSGEWLLDGSGQLSLES